MTGPCSTAVLESALAGNLPAEDEASLHRHLEECEDCRSALEQLAGGDAWCREVASLLTADELDDAAPAPTEWSEVDFTVEHLEPADEPNVLGRLGGYDVLEIIGRGGMGVVLKGYDRQLKRCVAIKVLSPHLAQSSLARNRFVREGQAAAAVVHPHVLAIHQVQTGGRLPFLVMPLVAGESLAGRLSAQGMLELKEILRIGMQAAAGLAAAHEQGLVHRDVKPANILLEKGVDRAVLTDFGLARAADDVALTRWGIIAGTPQYMSPEQARGEPLDGRSDLFSLGCILYEMATGVSPFRADSTMATLRRLVDDAPQAMASLNPELPPWFIRIVDRLLEKDPARRFGSAQQVSELLEGCLAHLQQPTSVPLPAVLTAPASRRLSPAKVTRFTKVITIIAVLGIGLLGALLLLAKPPDIAGRWSGEDWGTVVLKQEDDGQYMGTYTDTFGRKPGEIRLKWSRIERRYKGTWREGQDRFGKIAVRLVGDEVRGAWTASKKSSINPGTPELADLLWVRPGVEFTKRIQGGVDSTDKTELEGDWRLESIVGEGILGHEKALTARVRGNRWTMIRQGRESTYRFVLDARANPKTIDFVFDREKPLPPLIERGTYHLEGDTLRIAYGPPNSPRPTGGAKDHLHTWKRIKEESGLTAKRRLEVEGLVTDVSDGQVKIGIGRDDGIEPGMKLDVFREQVYQGRIEIIKAHPDRSVGRIVEEDVEAPIRTGDDVLGSIPVGETEAKKAPGTVSSASLLSEVIHQFNQQQRQHPIGKHQPLLTDDEVIGAIRWAQRDRSMIPLDEDEFRTFQSIAKTRVLPAGWKLEFSTDVRLPDGSRVAVWSVQLVLDRVNGTSYTHSIRQRALEYRPPTTQPPNESTEPLTGRVRLSGLVSNFNQEMKLSAPSPESTEESRGMEPVTTTLTQPPVTVDEVVASIRLQLNRQSDKHWLSAAARKELETIAATRTAPKGTVLEHLGRLTSVGFRFDCWTCRLEFSTSQDRCACYLRWQHLRSSEIPRVPDHEIAWGPPAEDGLQVGAKLVWVVGGGFPGGKYVPQFFFRNQTGKTIAAFEHRIVHFEVDARTPIGEKLPVKRRWGTVLFTIPVFPVEVSGDTRLEKPGAPILIGGFERKQFEEAAFLQRNNSSTWNDPVAAVNARIGESIRLRFRLPHPAKPDGPRLTTGELRVTAMKVRDARKAPGTVGFQPKTTASTLRHLPYSTTGNSVKVACSGDGKLIAVANGNPTRIMWRSGTSRVIDNWKPTAVILDAETGRTVVSLKLATAEEDAVLAATERISHFEVTALAFSPDGNVVAVGTSIGQVKLYDARTGELIRSLDDQQDRLEDKETPKSWQPLKRAMGSVASLAFSPDGSLLATCGGSFADFSDVFDGIERLGRRGTGPGRLKVWDAGTGTLKHDLLGHSYSEAVAFSPDGNSLASAGRWASQHDDGTGVILWNPQTGTKVRSFRTDANGGTRSVAFSPDSNMVAIGTQRFDKVSGTSTGGVSLTYPRSGITDWLVTVPGWAKPVAFSPDGKSIVVLCGDRTIRFLDVETGTVTHAIQPGGSRRDVRWVDFAIAPQTRTLAIGGVDNERKGGVELWSFDRAGTAAISAPTKAGEN